MLLEGKHFTQAPRGISVWNVSRRDDIRAGLPSSAITEGCRLRIDVPSITRRKSADEHGRLPIVRLDPVATARRRMTAATFRLFGQWFVSPVTEVWATAATNLPNRALLIGGQQMSIAPAGGARAQPRSSADVHFYLSNTCSL
ncbi:hypothetical protein EVAR_14001_1 [Eumeta japonica]|uniref:Uncharacterized protein n=1 Tax=Eumeta variegata TaxID=151549 RepID=A0A4C1XCZ5_EUMVA|nr:hypothetical protein EVAR_14001_1 [Eumeta japonica]